MSLLTDLVSYWKFDETSGTTLTDSHGSNDGINENVTINQTGKINKSYNTYKENNIQLIKINHNLDDFEEDDYSISFWYKISYETYDEGTPYVFDLRRNRNLIAYWLKDINSFAIREYNSSKDPIQHVLEASLDDDTWTHLVFVKTYGTGAKLYKNGSLVDSATYDWLAQTAIGYNYHVFMNNYGGINKRSAEANMDEVGIWSRALTSSEVSELYNGGAGLTYPFEHKKIGPFPMHLRE